MNRFARSLAGCLLLGLSGLFLQGCMLLSYGLGVATMANDSEVYRSKAYNRYVQMAEAENADRVKDGQVPQKILTHKEWSARQEAL